MSKYDGKWLNEVIEIKEGEKGPYLQFTKYEPVFEAFVERIGVAGPGATIQLKDFENVLAGKLDNGLIDQDRHDHLKESLSFIQFSGSMPPA